MAYNIEIAGVTYPDVPAVDLIDDDGNTVRFVPSSNISDKPQPIVPNSGGGVHIMPLLTDSTDTAV